MGKSLKLLPQIFQCKNGIHILQALKKNCYFRTQLAERREKTKGKLAEEKAGQVREEMAALQRTGLLACKVVEGFGCTRIGVPAWSFINAQQRQQWLCSLQMAQLGLAPGHLAVEPLIDPLRNL
ncbi:uncharacterized protein LOC144313908 isoform X2 [Canis aureus]